MKPKQRTSPIWTMPEEDFRELIKNSHTYSEILEHFGLKNRGANHKTLKGRINELGIQFNSIRYSIKNLEFRIQPIKNLLVIGCKSGNTYIKKRLINEGLLEEKCDKCNLGNIWEGKKLSLHLDHKNGNPEDYRLFNLRLLCPNCHSQTKNYCGKSKKQPPILCPNCGKPKSKKSILCSGCIILKYKEKYTPLCKKEELAQLIEIMPFTKIAEKFKVSDKTVVTWAKKYDIKKRFGRGEWAKLNSKPIPSKEEIEQLGFLPISDIGKHFSVSKNTARKWCKNYNIKRPNPKYWAMKRWK